MLRWNQTGITVAGIVGNPGTTTNQLNASYDIALDYANNLYIADRINNRTQKYLFGNSIMVQQRLEIQQLVHLNLNCIIHQE